MMQLKILRRTSSFQICHSFHPRSIPLPFPSLFQIPDTLPQGLYPYSVVPACTGTPVQMQSYPFSPSPYNSLHLHINIAKISDNSIVYPITLYSIVLVSRESGGRINSCDHHIVYGNGLDKMLYWFMLQFPCQKSLLMRVVAVSSINW